MRFDVPEGTQIDNILKGCATDPTTMSFSAQRTEDLLNAFRKISDALNVLKQFHRGPRIVFDKKDRHFAVGGAIQPLQPTCNN